MTIIFIGLLVFGVSNSLKIWIPNTNLDNKLNWDKETIPNECDSIHFQAQTEIETYWNLKKVIVSGLSLPQTGDIIFQHGVYIQFRNKEKCPHGKDVKYIRHEVKGWLDPNNWKSDSDYEWLPHSERVPCAGESVLFPPKRTFAVQLPSILVPIGDITFDSEVFLSDSWSSFLKTELGFQLFKGPDYLRNNPWRRDIGCLNNKKCICGRSSYTIRDGIYKEAKPHIFEEAVCLYAMPKCEPSACYSPVVPEGHCCAVCGAVIKIEDNSKEGINTNDIRAKVQSESDKFDFERKLKTYVGRTRNENIQIVVIAENPFDTTKSHALANLIKQKLIDQKLQAKITSRVSGLRLSNYLFNSVSGIVFGTLAAVLILFASLYYIYLVLPKKSSGAVNPFMFARFENLVTEDNLVIGVEPEVPHELPQAFSNPMYSGNAEPLIRNSETSSVDSVNIKGSETPESSEKNTTKEYTNPLYSELEKANKFDDFLEESQSN